LHIIYSLQLKPEAINFFKMRKGVLTEHPLFIINMLVCFFILLISASSKDGIRSYLSSLLFFRLIFYNEKTLQIRFSFQSLCFQTRTKALFCG
jgi:hypothetical protein